MDPLLISGALFLVAVVGGAQNAVAGGGSFFTFPTLVFAGVPSIEANATSTVALWPGAVASAFGYRDELRHERRLLLWLGAVSALGGLGGALLLLLTPQRAFDALIPWLLLAATLIFAFGPALTRRFRGRAATPGRPRSMWAFVLVQLVVAVYGGYFGGGIGIMMLASLAAMGMEDIHAMNGLKVILGALINGVAVITFIVAGRVVWSFALLMVAGSILGGYGGARLSKKIDAKALRWFIIAVGATLSAYFFWTTYA
jgi:uncharacterized membrane protein YfcA